MCTGGGGGSGGGVSSTSSGGTSHGGTGPLGGIGAGTPSVGGFGPGGGGAPQGAPSSASASSGGGPGPSIPMRPPLASLAPNIAAAVTPGAQAQAPADVIRNGPLPTGNTSIVKKKATFLSDSVASSKKTLLGA